MGSGEPAGEVWAWEQGRGRAGLMGERQETVARTGSVVSLWTSEVPSSRTGDPALALPVVLPPAVVAVFSSGARG